MLNKYLVPSCLVGVMMLTGVIPVLAQKSMQPTAANQESEKAKELQPDQISNIAQATVVRIEPSVGSAGSGVIIGKDKNLYTVLTSKKLVQDKNIQYDIVTPLSLGGTKHQKIRISPQKDIAEIADEDLAIVHFRSDRNYQVVTLVDSDDPEDCPQDDPQICNGLYVAGFANSATEKNRMFHVTQLQKKNKSLTYSNLPPQYNLSGLAGGPVFDGSGRVVTLFGKNQTQAKVNSKRRRFIKLRNYSNFGVRLNMTPPLLTISLRDPKPFNFQQEILETDIEVTNR